MRSSSAPARSPRLPLPQRATRWLFLVLLLGCADPSPATPAADGTAPPRETPTDESTAPVPVAPERCHDAFTGDALVPVQLNAGVRGGEAGGTPPVGRIAPGAPIQMRLSGGIVETLGRPLVGTIEGEEAHARAERCRPARARAVRRLAGGALEGSEVLASWASARDARMPPTATRPLSAAMQRALRAVSDEARIPTLLVNVGEREDALLLVVLRQGESETHWVQLVAPLAGGFANVAGPAQRIPSGTLRPLGLRDLDGDDIPDRAFIAHTPDGGRAGIVVAYSSERRVGFIPLPDSLGEDARGCFGVIDDRPGYVLRAGGRVVGWRLRDSVATDDDAPEMAAVEGLFGELVAAATDSGVGPVEAGGRDDDFSPRFGDAFDPSVPGPQLEGLCPVDGEMWDQRSAAPAEWGLGGTARLRLHRLSTERPPQFGIPLR